MDSAIVRKKRKVQTVLDPDALRALNARARAGGHTVSSYIRNLIHSDIGRVQ
jgi:hypothetical protein